MSWQRIDENTYIDDTLVTCAEYQLFIDEMREQEKYYQPDHWEIYQFPKDHARKPILGLRHADAVAFCGWLTKRDSENWSYRLPTPKEANAFPIVTSTQKLVGFWLDGNYKFAWIGNSYQNGNGISLDGATRLLRSRPKNRGIDPDMLIGFDYYRNIVCNRALDQRRERLRALDWFTDIAISIALNYGIINHVVAHSRKGDNPLDINHTIDLVQELGRVLANKSQRTHDFFSAVFELNLVHARDLALSNIRSPNSNRNFELALARGDQFNVFIDVYTLWERINNRYSTGFEGIRLVKERTK